MKYLNTTAIKSFVICCQFILLSSLLMAQKNTSSPYSMYGIGLLQANNFNSNAGSGGIGYAWRPSVYKPLIYDSLARSNASLNDRKTNYINPKNPASFSNISLTTFEVGAKSFNTQFKSDSQTKQDNNSGLSHFAIAFPVGEKLGLGFGLRPYSAVGYEYESSNSVNGASSTNKYEGSGGVNEFFLSGGIEISKSFSLGVSTKYLFGKIKENKRVIYSTSSASSFFNTINRDETIINSFSTEIGLQYFKNINSDYRMVIGVVASPIDELNGKHNKLVATYTGTENLEKIKDTINLTKDESIKVPFAAIYGTGISIEKIGKWAIEFDYTYRNWAENKKVNGVYFGNAMNFALGFEKFNEISSFGSYLKRMGYRFGLHHNTSLVNINGVDISETGLTFGFSMPLRKSFSTLNFGIELGKRGEDKNGFSLEKYMNVQVGLTINDKWFIKRKYD